MTDTVEAATEIIDDALIDLAGIGCTPLDRAAALIAVGLGELDDLDDLAGTLTVYRMLLEHVVAALQVIDGAATATRH
jgi:hypothetical protein